MKYILVLVFALFFYVSCSTPHPQENVGEVYRVDLDKKVNPFDEIFSRAEVVPLETNDNSLIVHLGKVYPWENKYCVYDYMSQKLLVFNHDGEFQYRIGKHGKEQGNI